VKRQTLALAALGVILAGCGLGTGSPDPSPTPTPTPTPVVTLTTPATTRATTPPVRSSTPPTPHPSTSSAPMLKMGGGFTCQDGTISHAAHRQGACSHHGGIA